MEVLNVLGIMISGVIVLFCIWAVLRLAIQYMYLGIRLIKKETVLNEHSIWRAHHGILYDSDWALSVIPLLCLPLTVLCEVIHCIVVLIRLLVIWYMSHYNVQAGDKLSIRFGFFVFKLFGVK